MKLTEEQKQIVYKIAGGFQFGQDLRDEKIGQSKYRLMIKPVLFEYEWLRGLPDIKSSGSCFFEDSVMEEGL